MKRRRNKDLKILPELLPYCQSIADAVSTRGSCCVEWASDGKLPKQLASVAGY